MEYLLKIHTKGSDAVYSLKYKNNKFSSIRHISGKVNQEQHERLLMLAPQLEQAILLLQNEYVGRVTWEPIIKEKSIYTQFMECYTSWYEDTFGIAPIIKATDGAAIKWFISNLSAVAGNELEALAVWKLIFENWSKLEDWYQNQTDLLQIKKNLNIILKQLKHGKSTEQGAVKADNLSNDYREKIKV